jgi:hypothetical protein
MRPSFISSILRSCLIRTRPMERSRRSSERKAWFPWYPPVFPRSKLNKCFR